MEMNEGVVKLQEPNRGCPHAQTRRIFAKKMCVSCYYQTGGKKNAWACAHTNKKLYSKGMCQSCYIANYYQEKKAKKQRLAQQGKAIKKNK